MASPCARRYTPSAEVRLASGSYKAGAQRSCGSPNTSPSFARGEPDACLDSENPVRSILALKGAGKYCHMTIAKRGKSALRHTL